MTDPKSELMSTICHIISKIPGCFFDSSKISPEHYLQEDLGLDSLALVDLVVEIEDNFDFYFDPVQINK